MSPTYGCIFKRMTTYLWLWTFIVIASLSYVTLALPLAQGNEDILAPPLLVKSTTAHIIVPPTLSPWMKLVQQRQSSSASTTPSVIRPPTIRPPKDLNQPTTLHSLHDLIQPPTLHPPLAPAPDPDSDPDSAPAPAPTPPLAVTRNPITIFPTKLPTPTLVSQTSRPVSIPVPAKALEDPVSNQGRADVTTGPAVVVNHQSVGIGIGIGIGRNGTSDSHTGSSLPSAALDASNASSNGAASFICYGRGPMTVDRDVPCPFESTRKAEMPPEFLEVLLRDEGGSIISSVMSASPPEHLMGFDLSNIESSDWMNFNQSDLGARLVEYIIQFEEHGRLIQQHLQDQVSSNRLQNITALTNLFIGVINATTNLNVCSSASSSASGSSSSNKELPCSLLVNHTVRLTEISFAVNNFLSVVQLSDSWLMNSTKSDVNNGGAYDNLDDIIVIDELLQKFNTTKTQFTIFVSLHKNLSSAIHDFNNTVAKVKDKLLHSVGDTDREKLNTRSYGSVEFKNVADVLAYVNNWRGESEDGEAHNNPTVDKSSEHNEQFVHERNTDNLSETLSMNTSTKSGIISYVNTSEQSADTKPAASETGSLDSANRHHDLSNLPKDSNQINSTIEYRENTEEERMDASGVRPEYLVQAALLGILDSLQEELSKLLQLPAPSNILFQTENDEALNNMTSWHHLRRRTRRDVAGFTIASETCQHQGRPINQSNYISLCTTCMHTTVLDDSLYPRYITEKICSNGSSSDPLYSNGCLFNPGPYSGGPGGLCQQQEFHIIVLQRVPGRCMKVFDQGQELVTDKWQSTTIPLKIGCECVVNENSQFAKYATFP